MVVTQVRTTAGSVRGRVVANLPQRENLEVIEFPKEIRNMCFNEHAIAESE